MVLESLERILVVLSYAAVIVGVLVASIQIRHANRLRTMDMLMRMYETFSAEAFQRHFWRVMDWQFDSLEAFEVEATDDDYATWFVVNAFFEGLGLLYRQRLAPLPLLDDALSAPIIDSWQRLEPLIVGYRRKYDRPQIAEWHERLAKDLMTRLARLEKKGEPGAGWRDRRRTPTEDSKDD